MCLVCYSPKERESLQQAFASQSPVKIVATKKNSKKRFNADTEDHCISKHARISPADHLSFPFNPSMGYRLPIFSYWTAWSPTIYTNCLYMSIKIIINYCLISTVCFVKTTLLHTPFYLYHPQVIFQYLFTAKHLVIVIVPQNMNTLKSFYQFCDSCKILPWAIYFKENNIKFFKCSK